MSAKRSPTSVARLVTSFLLPTLAGLILLASLRADYAEHRRQLEGPLLPPLVTMRTTSPMQLLAERHWQRSEQGSYERDSAPMSVPVTSEAPQWVRFRTPTQAMPLALALDYAGLATTEGEPPLPPASLRFWIEVECRNPLDEAMPSWQWHCAGQRDVAGGEVHVVRPAGKSNRREAYDYVLTVAESPKNLRRIVKVDGRERIVLRAEHRQIPLSLPPDTDVSLYFGFTSSEALEFWHLRTALIAGDYTTQAPPPRLALSPVVAATSVLLVLAMLLSAVIRLRSSDPYDSANPPKWLGGLLAVFGLALSYGGWSIQDGYFLVIGLLLAWTGRLLYFGQALALLASTAMVMAVWAGSWLVAEHSVAELLPRVTLPTLLWLYLQKGPVGERLGQRF